MAYVTRIGSSAEQVEYRLTGGHGCPDTQFAYRSAAGIDGVAGPLATQDGYRTDARERPLRWIGKGLASVGIEAGGELATDADLDKARALMAGAHPESGEQLVARKQAVYEDAKVPLAPLVAAIREEAQHRGTTPGELLGSDRAAKGFASAERAVESDGELARRRADHAGQLAEVAGLDVESVWGVGVYAEAVGNLTETITTTNEEGKRVETVVPRRRTVGNSGYDISLTLPKSMSLLLAFAEDGTADEIEAAYTEQVGRTFEWIEAETAYQMRGHHGDGKSAEVVEGKGLLGWTMVHRASRPVGDEPIGDPHWHVHVAVANMTEAEDGKWGTIAAGGRDLMRHAPAADHVFKALVRYDLTTRYGVKFERNERNGAWEVADIPDETLREFSRRGMNIQGVLAAMGVTNSTAHTGLKMRAESADRGGKDVQSEASDLTLRGYWQQRAEESGHDVAGMVARVVAGEGTAADAVDVEQVRARLADPETGLTGSKRRFSRIEAVAAVADALEQGIGGVDELVAFTDHVLADGRFPETASGPDRGINHSHLTGATLHTTSDVLAAERTIFKAAKSEDFTHAAVTPAKAGPAISVTEVGQGYELSAEQKSAVLHLTGSSAAVDTLIGPPGTGKTTMLRAARAVWESAGYTVAGAATAAIAAQNLETESGIRSTTVAALTWAGGDADALHGVDVLVVDEANLTDDRARARLYELAAEHHTKIVEVGDPRQLRGVGCGSAFSVLHEVTQGATVEQNRRQRDAEDRTTLEAWRDGRYTEALESWSTRGRLVVTDTLDETVAGMVGAWHRETSGAPTAHDRVEGVVMLAPTNEEVRLINAAVQASREQLGDVEDTRTYDLADGHSLRVGIGDQVLMRRNDRLEGEGHTGAPVLNGYRGVVTGIDHAGHVDVEWRVDTLDGPKVDAATLSPEYVRQGGLDLGYAVTTHKAEGLTVAADWTRADGERQDGTVIASISGMDNPGLYVAGSRHKGKFVAFASDDVLTEATPELNESLPEPQTRAEFEQVARTRLAVRAKRTAENANDKPITEVPKVRKQPQQDVGQMLDALAEQQRADQERREHDEAARREAAARDLADAERDRGFDR